MSAAEGEIIGASNRFAFDLLAQADSPNANLLLSPLSASMALGMTMNGAAGETWNQMRDVLGFGSLAQEEIVTAGAGPTHHPSRESTGGRGFSTIWMSALSRIWVPDSRIGESAGWQARATKAIRAAGIVVGFMFGSCEAAFARESYRAQLSFRLGRPCSTSTSSSVDRSASRYRGRYGADARDGFRPLVSPKSSRITWDWSLI